MSTERPSQPQSAAIHHARQSGIRIQVSPSWIIVIPLGGWAIITLFLPVLGGQLSRVNTWLAALIILVLVVVSLAGHVGAHLIAARLFRANFPERILWFVFGDIAQGWPQLQPLKVQVGIAAAGPLASGLLAGAAYWLWNLQLGPVLNITMLFAVVFNTWLAAINLLPAFPFDGGQLIRAVALATKTSQASATRLARRLGGWVVIFLAGWGIFLLTQDSRFSLQTAAVTVLFAGLMAWGLANPPAPSSGFTATSSVRKTSRAVRAVMIGFCTLLLAAGPAALLLTNNGIEAPGLALAVEPMVSVPASDDHPHPGSFILTSVLEQAPIPAGEWAISQFDRRIKIVPPDQIVPKNSSLQQQAQQGYQQLDDSETTAAVVALRLAGYPAKLVGKGAQLASILKDSPSRGVLQPGDVITALNGNPIQTSADLMTQVKAQTQAKTVRLQVERDGSQLELVVPLMPPATPGGPPRIGVTVQTAGLAAVLPFPVKITSQKIVGGPSAGLMFTLTVFNALSPTDLTGGRKIAGTGTINPDGTVGPIGGVAQKVIAAENAGASYFLSPVENYPDARAAARNIKVIPVATAEQAVKLLQSLPSQ